MTPSGESPQRETWTGTVYVCPQCGKADTEAPNSGRRCVHGGVQTHDPMTLAQTPRQREFVTFLRAIEAMTEDDLAEAVASCPPHVRECLARGPKPYRWDCAVCDAFGRQFYKGGMYDASDPMWRAWGYHEVPKLLMRRSRELHYGEHADATYRRCIATYEAAGWSSGGTRG